VWITARVAQGATSAVGEANALPVIPSHPTSDGRDEEGRAAVPIIVRAAA